MGKNVATSVVNDVINVSTTVINDDIQSANVTQQVVNRIIVDGSDNVFIQDIEQMGLSAINKTQFDQTVNSTNLSTVIDSKVDQRLKQFIARFLPQIGSNRAKEITKIGVNLANTVFNESVQTCNLTAVADNDISVTNSQGVVIQGIKQDTYIKDYTRCLSRNTNTARIANQLRQEIEQDLSQTSIGPIALAVLIPLLIILGIAILLMIGFVIFGVVFDFGLVKHAGGFLIILLIGLLVISGGLIIGYFFQWWPYEETLDLNYDDDSSDARRRNLIILIISIIVFVVTGLILVYAAYHHHKEKKNAEKYGTDGKTALQRDMLGTEGEGNAKDNEVQEVVLLEELKGLRGRRAEEEAKQRLAQEEQGGGAEATQAEELAQTAERVTPERLEAEGQELGLGDIGEEGIEGETALQRAERLGAEAGEEAGDIPLTEFA